MNKLFFSLCMLIAFPTFLSAQTASAPSAGDGTPGNPYRIANLDNLYWLSQNNGLWASGKYFMQTANIDASETSGWFANGSGGFYGFPPIGSYGQGVGNQAFGAFSANYDGQGYAINNLYINRSPEYVALFGYCNNAVINNMKLVNPVVVVGPDGGSISSGYQGNAILMASGSVTINNVHIINGSLTVNSWHNYIGGMLGRTQSVIATNCSADVTMNDTTMYGGGSGGFIGYSESSNSVFTNCSSTGSIKSNQSFIGGFTGMSYAGSYHYNRCYSTCSISSAGYSGGFSGATYDGHCAYTDCYATGNVTASNSGGFNGYTNSGTSSFTNCYASGTVSGSGTGGFGGSAGLHTYTNCFYDSENSGSTGAFGSGSNAGVTGKTTAGMSDAATFADAGWAFAAPNTGTQDYWFLKSGYNGGYPSLAGNIRDWTGAESTDWLDAANWKNNLLPDSNSLIQIQSSAANMPAISAAIKVNEFDFNGSALAFDLGNNDVVCNEALGYDSAKYFKTTGTGVLKITIPNTRVSIFPAGLSAGDPVAVTNNSGFADDFTVKVLDEMYANGTDSGTYTKTHVMRTWDIEKATANAGDGVDLVFGWNSGEAQSNIISPALFHYTNEWEKQTGTTIASGNSLRYVGYTGNFSPFAIAEGTAVLAVNMLDFSAHKQSKTIVLDWATAQETGTKKFIIQHSENGSSWSTLGQTPAAVNSSISRNYTYTDEHPYNDVNYYRLVLNNLDGSNSYSKIVKLQYASNSLFTVAPTLVTTGSINIYLSKPAMVQVFNQSGSALISKYFAAGQQQMDVSRLSKGTYYIQSGGQTIKVVIQ